MRTLGWLLEAGAAATVLALLAVKIRARGRGRVVETQAMGSERVVVREASGHRELWLMADGNATLQTRITLADSRVSGIPYTDGFHLYPPRRGTVLFVGAGGGVAPRQFVDFYPELRVQVVEHDRAVLALAEKYFDLRPDDRLEIELADGRAALERPAAHALIVIDAFGAGDFPGRLATVELFRLCRDRLAAGGALVVNLAGTFAGSVLCRLYAGIAEAFGDGKTLAFGVPAVDTDPPYAVDRAGNTIVFAFRDAVPTEAPGARVPAEARGRLRFLDPIGGRRLSPEPAVEPFHDDSVPPSLPIQ